MSDINISIDEYPLGARIKHFRTRRKITQVELAQKCGLTQGAISLIEKSQASPSLKTIYTIAKVLNVHEARLFAGEEVPVLELNDLKKRYKTWDSLTPSMRRQFKKVQAYLESLR